MVSSIPSILGDVLIHNKKEKSEVNPIELGRNYESNNR